MIEFQLMQSEGHFKWKQDSGVIEVAITKFGMFCLNISNNSCIFKEVIFIASSEKVPFIASFQCTWMLYWFENLNINLCAP